MHSVTEKTAQTYGRHWADWCHFVLNTGGIQDPFLEGWTDCDKGTLVGLLLQKRHEEGLRGKQANAITAGIRLYFTRALLSTSFLDSAILDATRTACRYSTTELRARKDMGPVASVKLPISEDIMLRMRARLWEGKGWGLHDSSHRMTYLGCMWGYDLDARVSEYTAPEKGQEDHCVRAGDLVFCALGENGELKIRGGTLSLYSTEKEMPQFYGCWVKPSTHKTGAIVKAKFIGRRSVEESQFLDDLVEWTKLSKVKVGDRLFTRYSVGINGKMTRKELTSRMIRDGIKESCTLEGLDSNYFSSHSLRKGATTHMMSLGVPEADVKDRGNYSQSSDVMNRTYDYSFGGHGPLAANSLRTGNRPSLKDVKQYVPQEWDKQAMQLGMLGEGSN